ncbi:MAG: DUF4013 domain-containing protein [Dehalococcoidia bacterium]|nr:DUF4013 domain-containing protein [Dehalococcoidia bacterium]MCB9593733.1 DUF4013 domain-containing protein [Sandaracinaceae bacterium]
MQYLRGWTALKNDPAWMGKVGWATLILLTSMCIPVVGQIALLGWNTLMLRRAISGQDSPLPRMEFDIDYLTKLLNVGFKGFLASLLWSLPFIAAFMAGYCCMYAGIFGIVGGAGLGAEAGGDAGGVVGLVVGVLFMCLAFLVMFTLIVVANMVMQVAVMRAEITDDVNAALRFKEVMDMTKLIAKELFIGLIVMQLIGMLVGFVGIFTLYVLLFPGVIVMQVIMTYWRAELYRVYLEKGGQPLPIGPLAVPGGDPPMVGPTAGSYTAPAAF